MARTFLHRRIEHPLTSLSTTQHPTESIPRIALAFLKLGCVSFGGPVAHLGYLREEFVVRRKWLDDAAYADLVALCQFLPGPASSQVVFGLGMGRAGLRGGIAASIGFTLPSALLMVGFAYAVVQIGDLQGAGWLHGLKVAAVSVVAHAVWGMGKRLCPDLPRVILAIAAAVVLVLFPGAVVQVSVILGGALIGWIVSRNVMTGGVTHETRTKGRHPGAVLALVTWGALLVALPAMVAATQSRTLELFDLFYRAGSLVFGGGHVVLPLLYAEMVPQGWINHELFIAGYGAAQALPGPLFTLAAYLGVHAQGAWTGGLLGVCEIFLPSWLLVGGALPFWNRLRDLPWAQAGMRGANVAVVGVLLAALYAPVCTEGIRYWGDAVAAAIGLYLLQYTRFPPWGLVLLAAAAGQWVL